MGVLDNGRRFPVGRSSEGLLVPAPCGSPWPTLQLQQRRFF